MNSISKWLRMGNEIDFSVSLYYGGGLGDLTHRLYDSYYLRALRHIKTVFPNLKVYLFLDTARNIESVKALFDVNPYLECIVACRQEFLNQDIYAFATNLMGRKKSEIGKYLPDIPNEVVFQRVVNRAYELLAFPRLRTITMDDFFQQLKLDINYFEMDEPTVYLKPEETTYGQAIKKELCPVDEKLVAIHFFSGDGLGMIKPSMADKIIRWLIDRKYRIAILGTERESNPDLHESDFKDMVLVLKEFKGHPHVKYLCDDSNIRMKVSVIANSDYMICNDSGLMHIAWLYKTKTISLFPKYTPQDRFQKEGGYYWAIVKNEPYTSYIFCDETGKFDITLLEQRINNFKE